MSYDLCEYNNSHPGMRRQSQALRLAIKQATNAKLVSQANKPQRSLSRRTLRNSDVASKLKGFIVNMRVAVLDTTKNPLAPTTPRRARLLLKSGKAAVFRRYPFTLILKREVVGVQTPDLRLKVDPGSKTTGLAIVHQETGEVVFAAEIGHRGQAIKKNLDARRAIRRGRRHRKTRYREPRFDNRRRSEGSLPPSLESRVENTLTWSRRLIRVYPIKGLGLELVKFDMQLMQNPEINGVEYQQGELEGFELREYVLIKFNHKCAYAGDDSPCDEILNVDHVAPRSGGGSNRVSNLALRIKATGRGTRQMCSTNKYGFPIRHRTRRKTFLGFETGDIVKADIPRGKYEGRYVGRVTIRQRPSFILNGFDTHPKYLKRIHRSDGYDYQGQIKNGSRANEKQQKAHGHSTSLP